MKRGFVGLAQAYNSPLFAARLMTAIETVTTKRIHTPDLDGEATTAIVTEAVCDSL